MTYEEALAKIVAEGAIRAYRLSDTTAYAYRLKDKHYEARTLIGTTAGDWKLGITQVSSQGVERHPDGWYRVIGLPRRARPIELDEAKKNPGYSQLVLRQCYTCKKYKPEAEFERAGNSDASGSPAGQRNWECNECYTRRQRELVAFKRGGAPRKGDSLDRVTLASPPPPRTEI